MWKDNMTAQKWIESHMEEIRQHSGKWLAVDFCGIVAVGEDMESVLAEASKKGCYDPIVFKLPCSSSRPKIASPKKIENKEIS